MCSASQVVSPSVSGCASSVMVFTSRSSRSSSAAGIGEGRVCGAHVAAPRGYRIGDMLDFEQLAFIEKLRQEASRGIVGVLDGARGNNLVTLDVGEGPARADLRGQDATGAVR